MLWCVCWSDNDLVRSLWGVKCCRQVMPKLACAIRPLLVPLLLFRVCWFNRGRHHGCWLASLSKIVPSPLFAISHPCERPLIDLQSGTGWHGGRFAPTQAWDAGAVRRPGCRRDHHAHVSTDLAPASSCFLMLVLFHVFCILDAASST
jgi:hypothetical protein